MSELLLSGHTTLHDISGGSPQFVGNAHVQSSEGDFLYALPSQKDLDDGQINFIPSKQGYALVQIRKPGGPNLVALKAISPKPVTARIWTDSLAPPVTPPGATVEVAAQAPKKNDSNRNLSILLWVAVLLVAVYFLSKSQKNGRQLKTSFQY